MENEKRLIDVNAVIKDIDDYYHNSPFPHPGTTWLRGLELAVGLLLRSKTVDAVEVVRCKDCIHRHTRNNCLGRRMDFFCADGERVGRKWE